MVFGLGGVICVLLHGLGLGIGRFDVLFSEFWNISSGNDIPILYSIILTVTFVLDWVVFLIYELKREYV